MRMAELANAAYSLCTQATTRHRATDAEICKSFKLTAIVGSGAQVCVGAVWWRGAAWWRRGSWGISRALSAVIVWTSFYVPTISHYKNYVASIGIGIGIGQAGQQTRTPIQMRWQDRFEGLVQTTA